MDELIRILIIVAAVYGALRLEFFVRRWRFRRDVMKAKNMPQSGSQPADPFHPALNPCTGTVEGAATAILCDSCHEPTTDYKEYCNGARHCFGCTHEN